MLVITAQKGVSTDPKSCCCYVQRDEPTLGLPLQQLFLYVRCAYVYGRKVSMGFRKGACMKLSKVVDVLGDAWSRKCQKT